MNRKLIIGSVLAVFLLVAVSYASAMDTIKNVGNFSEQEVDKQQNPSDKAEEPLVKNYWTSGKINCNIYLGRGSFTRNGIQFILRNVVINSDNDIASMRSLKINFIKQPDLCGDFNEVRMAFFIGWWIGIPSYLLLPDVTFNGFALGISIT